MSLCESEAPLVAPYDAAMAETIATGTVAALWRWPVKSFGGEPVAALRIDGRGAGGDRTHALWDVTRDKRLTAREAPRILRWHAAYPDDPGDRLDPAAPPSPTLTAPDGTVHAWDDPALPGLLGDDLDRPVRLTRDTAGQQDLGRSLLVTTEASLAALRAELGDDRLDLRRFRPNLHLHLDADPFAEERGWEGGAITVGDAVLDVLHPCVRCVIPTRDPDTTERNPAILRHLAAAHETLFGINVRPRGAATIRCGDPVRVTAPPA